jgi:hypothetical protein
MNNPLIFENPCAICKVREATRLCDYVMEYNRNLIFIRDYKKFKEANERGHDETCDLPLCERCSHETNKADLCPHHHKLQQKAELPKHLKQAQMRQKAKVLRGESE